MKKIELLILVSVLLCFNCQTAQKVKEYPFKLYVLTQGQPWDLAIKVEIINNYVYCGITREKYEGSNVIEIKEKEAEYYIAGSKLNELQGFLDELNIFELKEDYSNEDDTSEFDIYVVLTKDNKQKEIHIGPSDSVSEINKLIRYLNENICVNGIKLLIN